MVEVLEQTFQSKSVCGKLTKSICISVNYRAFMKKALS